MFPTGGKKKCLVFKRAHLAKQTRFSKSCWSTTSHIFYRWDRDKKGWGGGGGGGEREREASLLAIFYSTS